MIEIVSVGVRSHMLLGSAPPGYCIVEARVMKRGAPIDRLISQGRFTVPIRPEFRHFYGREWREEIRPRILARAGNKCERCGAANKAIVRKRDGVNWTEIQLGVAHLNHDPSDRRDENLAALCRGCHLNYDRLHHKDSRSIRKDAGRPLLVAVGA